jgi:hypothetical protein
MNWRTKAAIQRAISRLPFGRETVYYAVQRNFGNLRNPEPITDFLRHAANIFHEIEKAGTSIQGARVFEFGTGPRINMPLAFYLAGAASVTTVDLHPVLKPSLVMRDVKQLNKYRGLVSDALRVNTEKLMSRIDRISAAKTFQDLCDITQLNYLAPCDAANTALDPGSFDIHFSYTVCEHIPSSHLLNILVEAGRLISGNGICAHLIDLSDHFSHGNGNSLSPINFLQFSEAEWSRINASRFGYQNRLREPDYQAVYRTAGHQIVTWDRGVHPQALADLRDGLRLAPEFQNLEEDVLATTTVLAITRRGL